MKMVIRKILVVCFLGTKLVCLEPSPFHQIYPFNSFKEVVDTCMRSYSDMLVLQDQIATHEKSDEQLDLLVGRLMRLQSYIEQLLHEYRYEATINADDLAYLLRMMEYLEATGNQTDYKDIAQGLNAIISHFKQDLQKALSKNSLVSFIPVKSLPYPCLPLKYPLHQVA